MNFQTPLEQFVDDIIRYNYAQLVSNENFEIKISLGLLKHKMQQAKKIEKEEILKAFDEGKMADKIFDSETYYNNKYGE